MAALDSLAELNNILEEWNTEAQAEGLATQHPLPRLKRLAELVEHETENFYKMDPDPFDDRHPGRSHPTCTLGHMFKTMLKNDDFMNRFIFECLIDRHGDDLLSAAAARLLFDLLPTIEKKNVFTTLVNSYVLHPHRDAMVQTMACRLLYDVLLGLETTVVFQETEGLVEQLFKWAEKGEEPLSSYATGLLAGAMDIQDIASNYKEKNSALVPKMLKRLHTLQKEMHEEYVQKQASKQSDNSRHFSMFGSPGKHQSPYKVPHSPKGKKSMSPARDGCSTSGFASGFMGTPEKVLKLQDEHNKENHYSNTRLVPDTLNCKASGTDCKDSEIKPVDVTTLAQKIASQLNDLSPKCSATTSGTSPKCSAASGDNTDMETETAVKCNEETADSVKCGEGVCAGGVSISASSTATEGDDKETQVSGNPSMITVLSSASQTLCCSKHLLNKNKPDSSDGNVSEDSGLTLEERKAKLKRTLSPVRTSSIDIHAIKDNEKTMQTDGFLVSDVSNSSWAEIESYVIGSYSLEPLTLSMKQRLILQYLTPMAEYQELIGAAFEYKAMDLVFYYINLKYNKDVRLAFEALKYLAVLLCHKKFTIEFLHRGGLQSLLDVYRPSIAATGVSLCLYYLSYFEDAMERVCLVQEHVLDTLVSYVLWLLECSHDSSRCHAAMFFTQGFPYLCILAKFDAHDGLRRLFNVISTLEILNIETNASTLSEDRVFTMRQYARHVCVALKRYFESHLVLKVNELKRSLARNEGGSPQHEIPAYKAVKTTPDVVQENIELLMELMPIRQQWAPEATFHKLGGLTLLSQLVAMSPEWASYTGKPETIKAAMDVISVCCVTPKSQLLLLDSIPLPDNVSTPGISVFIGLAEGEIFSDPDVQKSALSVIINCVCGPLERLGGGVGRYMGSGSRKKINWRLGEDILLRMWNGVRENNGIMVLLKLLSVKTPITDADTIRALACKALVGMSRSETVRQIISKLPLFSNGQLQVLMKEPVLQDKRQEHVKFCRNATELIEKVSGQEANRYSDASLDDIRKADIVAQSKIIYNEKELLQLIYDHLHSKGYHDSCDALHREASLPHCNSPPPVLPANPTVFPPPHLTSPSLFVPVSSASVLAPRPIPSRQQSHPGASQSLVPIPSPQSSHSVLPTSASSSAGSQQQSQASNTPGTSGSGTSGLPEGPIRFNIGRTSQQQNTPNTPSASSSNRTVSRYKYIKERDTSLLSPAVKKTLVQRSQNSDYEISLDKIVTEYLRKQHALCRNPVVTCPPMSLFHPHRCPEPRGYSCAPINLAARTIRKLYNPRFGGMDGCKLDRKFIYSRFKPVKTYKETEDDGFSCCTFTARQDYLMLGTYAGSLKLIHTKTAEETGSFHCHNSPVTHCEHSQDGKLVLTASSYSIMYSSALWSWGTETLDNVYNFEDHHIEFSRHVQDRLIGTKDEVGSIYDVSTGQLLLKLNDVDKANNYKANRAVFNPTDDLALNDGVLWDVRAGKAVHKFDKFNQYVSGVFHPVGLEIIINSEVWDIRTFRLLHTVPALDQCQICFSHLGDVMYATRIDEELDHDNERHNPYGSTFRTFDATNYAHIATMDVKSRSISDLCTDGTDTYLAVVENQQSADMGAEENICRLYEIGKMKDDTDDQNEDEEDATQEDEEEEEEEDDDDDDDDLEDILMNGDEVSNAASGESDQEANEEGGDGENEDEGGDGGDDDDDDDDDDDAAVLSIGSSEDDDDDDFDLDLEDAFFELADF